MTASRRVDAARAREHLLMLSAAGIGRRTVSDCTGLACFTLQNIRGGQRRIEAATANKILAVTLDQRPDHARIAAGTLWVLVNELRQEGYTRKDLELELGRDLPVRHRKTVGVGTLDRVRRLHRRLLGLDASTHLRQQVRVERGAARSSSSHVAEG